MKITVQFDKKLQKITGYDSFTSECSEGITFLEFIYFLFESYPLIQKRYPPGVIGMNVNNLRPLESTELKDGDVVKLWVAKEKIH